MWNNYLSLWVWFYIRSRFYAFQTLKFNWNFKTIENCFKKWQKNCIVFFHNLPWSTTHLHQILQACSLKAKTQSRKKHSSQSRWTFPTGKGQRNGEKMSTSQDGGKNSARIFYLLRTCHLFSCNFEQPLSELLHATGK